MSENLHPAAASAPRPAWLEQLPRYVVGVQEHFGDDGAFTYAAIVTGTYSEGEWVKYADVLAACPPPAEARDTIDWETLARGVRMLGVMKHEHPQAFTYNQALDMAAEYIRSFKGREQYLPKPGRAPGRPEGPTP